MRTNIAPQLFGLLLLGFFFLPANASRRKKKSQNPTLQHPEHNLGRELTAVVVGGG